ncbi:MAG TPA: periplasmic heavy metal sensor [Pantanalinema sp.]
MKARILPALFALTLGLATLGAPAAFAGPDGPRGHGDVQRMVERRMDRMFRHLEVTPEQRTKLEEIHRKQTEFAKAQRQVLKSKEKELSTLLKSPSATRDQALAKNREIDGIKQKLSESRIQSWFDSRAVLTPEQLKKMEAFDFGAREGKGFRRDRDDKGQR